MSPYFKERRRIQDALELTQDYWTAKWAKASDAKGRRLATPHKKAIAHYWAPLLEEMGKGYADDFIDGQACFACGQHCDGTGHASIDRAHIKPVVKFRGKFPHAFDNLHLLCTRCHVDSEYLEGDRYWRWFKQMDLAGRMAINLMTANPEVAAKLLLGDKAEALQALLEAG